MGKYTICAIIVSYNRKELLLRCIDAVLSQTYHCSELLIVDNDSSDGTSEAVCQKFGYNSFLQRDIPTFIGNSNRTKIRYILKSSNEGGSGGFATGLEISHKTGKYDAFWMMDDDGYPSQECLDQQVRYLNKYDYVMPVSIDIDDHSRLSWPTVLPGKSKTISYSQLKDKWGKIMSYVYPFNGCLLGSRLVDSVGYVDKRLFIWGDEYDHYWRCRTKGFDPITVINARFYHPSNKMTFVPIMFGLIKVPFVEAKWKMVCLARNYTYIYRHYNQKYKIPLKFLLYSWLFLVSRKGDFQGWKLYIYSVKDGFKERFDRHQKYMKF